jgi:hypothetical protein
MYRSTSDQRVDLGVFWKPAKLFFREDEFAVDGDFENTGHPLDELDLLRASFHQSCPRTEGSWFVVSGHAIFDSYLHCRHLRCETSGCNLARRVYERHYSRSAQGYPSIGLTIICLADVRRGFTPNRINAGPPRLRVAALGKARLFRE